MMPSEQVSPLDLLDDQINLSRHLPSIASFQLRDSGKWINAE
jgi:hypothetical protein